MNCREMSKMEKSQELQDLISMEITVTSRETIKPSSPTPHHLRRFKLSLIDQYMHPAYYTRIILFYSAHGDARRFQTTNVSHRLRKSLSEVLTEFYPLAGRFNNNESIDCNDDGLEYVEARVKPPLTLSHLLNCSQVEELDPLLPYDAYNYGAGFRGLSAVQITVFDSCGGMAIGVSLSHILADAASLGIFINRWGVIARRGDALMTPEKSVAPKLGFASLFPPRSIPVQTYEDIEVARKLVTKRFVFPQMKIDALKGEFVYERPTRVEAVSALILKCLINLSSKSRSTKSISMTFAINLRSRMSPPLPAQSFGNIALSVAKQIGAESLNDFGVQLRKLIKEVDNDYLEKLLADNSFLLFEELERWAKLRMNNDVRFFDLSSWCRLPFYEADVGWGTPTWVAPVYLSFQDSIILLDAKNGNGIEVWATMDRDDMEQFEFDDELLDFVCPNSRVGGPH